MSGFSGIVRFGGTTASMEEDRQRATRMAEQIAWRGPDKQNQWDRGGAHFAFSLFRTGPAPQAESQPSSLDGIVWLMGDIRLEGRKELQRELEQAGEAVADTCTDEELVLRVFRKWGVAGLQKLAGDFSFVLWDEAAQNLLALRSFFGAKPFFYVTAKNVFSFSNTLAAAKCAEGFQGELDEVYVEDFLLAGWCLELERSAFRDIKRLAPGHLLKFSAAGMEIRRLLQLPIEEPLHFGKQEECVEAYLHLLEQAVEEQLPAHGAAAYVSGGLDSTTVAIIAAEKLRASGKKLYAHSVDLQPLFEDKEGEAAERFAREKGIEFDLLHGGRYVPYEGWDAEDFPLPEPQHEPLLAFSVDFCRRAAKHARVGLSGDGGDDVLLGHGGTYLRNLLKQGKLGQAAKDFGGYIATQKQFPVLRFGFRARLKRWIRGEAPVREFPEWIREVDKERLRERMQEIQSANKQEHPLHPEAYAMLSGSFWPTALEIEDMEYIGARIERRMPLLDLRLTRFLLRIPPVPWCMDKYLVRTAMRGRLPEAIRTRPKTPMAQDPFELLSFEGIQERINSEPPSPVLRKFVNWEIFPRILKESAPESMSLNLRPVSLGLWLKSVEKK